MPAKILVVEDNPTNLYLMEYLLGAYGHTVKTATDALTALAAIEAERFDLILADVLMPKMDGFEFLKRAKSAHADGPPIVAVTALAMVGNKEAIMESGFDGYIAKPISPETFVGEVDSYLPGAKRSKATSGSQPRSVDDEPGRPRPAGRTILAVDDVPTNTQVLRATLEPFGYNVVEARSMNEALEIAARVKPDLVVTDVHMPSGSGYDLIRAFKADPDLHDVVFVFVSSTYWHELDRARGLSLGASKFLVRPIDPQTLVTEITETLQDADG
ncbi:MAG TPA: response regulator [Candidatus Eremiobacteraceae bacterium]|nr:response regulator [Candidatus Eremiobacteraceae bacterium]